MPRTLYLVATPIGNLADISARAIKILMGVDVVAAEDTRNTQKLLSYFGIQGKELISYYEHNKRERGEIIAAKIEAGASCALVTDAGTAAISDPGGDLVRLCAERGITVSAVPGPCAAINALSLSSLATGRFCFEGFLSTNAGERKKRLEELQNETRTMIFYEAPHKLKKTLDDLFAFFGDRSISLCREMTKLNEEVMRTTLSSAIKHYSENAPRGEYVLVLEGGSAQPQKELWFSSLSHEEHVAHYEQQGLSRMDAIKAAAKDLGISKSELYKAIHTN
ncbi:MAG: 16S rRNA (cytidine(1402)-2'-O)-methyltransferase [Clostridia bacterium]|nr:16S rRNA (cytidine(1402)-2'-O)-methyltransferase [Clostridia bacterium]